MPIVRRGTSTSRSPHIYEIYFEQNGMKAISYIGKSSGQNPNYVSGSSELNRVIANTALCFGEREAELGWHKSILAEFPAGTPESVLEKEEKKYILASYEESKRLGPGKNWEILNKSHLGGMWSQTSKAILAKLRAGEKCETTAETGYDRSFQAITSGPRSKTGEIATLKGTGSQVREEDLNDIKIEANFFQKIGPIIGARVSVPLMVMAIPGLKRSEVKARIFLMVLRAIQLKERHSGNAYVVKTSTLGYLLREPNLSPGQCSGLFEVLAKVVELANLGKLILDSIQKGVVSFFYICDEKEVSITATANILYEEFMRVASSGRHATSGRRYFAILAASQYFLTTGKGIPRNIALPMLTGREPPAESDSKRWAELQSTCSKALKQSNASLQRALGTTFATNYFTKKMLRGVEPRFSSRRDDFQVLLENSETSYADFYTLLAE